MPKSSPKPKPKPEILKKKDPSSKAQPGDSIGAAPLLVDEKTIRRVFAYLAPWATPADKADLQKLLQYLAEFRKLAAGDFETVELLQKVFTEGDGKKCAKLAKAFYKRRADFAKKWREICVTERTIVNSAT